MSRRKRSFFDSSLTSNDHGDLFTQSFVTTPTTTIKKKTDIVPNVRTPNDDEQQFVVDMTPRDYDNLITVAKFTHISVSGVKPYDYKKTSSELVMNLVTRVFTATIDSEIQWDDDMIAKSQQQVAGQFFVHNGEIHFRVRKRSTKENIKEHIPTVFSLVPTYFEPMMYLGKFMGMDLVYSEQYDGNALQLLWQPGIPIQIGQSFADCFIKF
jgi:hypothetical protein